MESQVIIEERGRVALIKLHRPEQRNSLNGSLIEELSSAFNLLGRNNSTRVILLSGDGAAFCSGMDLAYLEESIAKSQDENREDAEALLKMLLGIQNCKKPVIALVNGPAMGGGCGIAAACDYVFASSETAKFGVPEVRLGFVPAVILHFLLKRMGQGRTREFVLQGEILDAAGAKACGLATEVVPQEKLLSRGLEFAEQLATSTSGGSVMLTKELLARFDEMTYKETLEFAANLNAMVRKTDDFKRGVQSFLKKERITW